MGGTPVPTARPALPSHDGQDVKRTCPHRSGFHHPKARASQQLCESLCAPRRSAKGTAGVRVLLSACRSAWSSPSGAGFRVGSPRPSPQHPAFRRPPLSLLGSARRPRACFSSEHRPAQGARSRALARPLAGWPRARAPLIGGAGPGPAPGRGVRAGGPDAGGRSGGSAVPRLQPTKERDAPAAQPAARPQEGWSGPAPRAPPSGSRSYLSSRAGPRRLPSPTVRPPVGPTCGRGRRPGPLAPDRPSGRGRCGPTRSPLAPAGRQPTTSAAPGCGRGRGRRLGVWFLPPPPRAWPVFPGRRGTDLPLLSPPHSASCPPPLTGAACPGLGVGGSGPGGRARRPLLPRGAACRVSGRSASSSPARRLRYPATGARPPVVGRFLGLLLLILLTHHWWRLHLW